MKEYRIQVIIALSILMVICSSSRGEKLPPAPQMDLPFYVYSDLGMPEAGYDFSPSGWMGNTDAIEYDDCAPNPCKGDCCIKVTFDDKRSWGGIVWQNPAENWGEDEGGLDLTGAKQLSFWARGENGGEMVEFKMGVIKRNKKFHDTASVSLGKVKLSKQWKQYVMDLKGKDLSRIVTGFSFSVKGKSKPVIFYLDEIIFE